MRVLLVVEALSIGGLPNHVLDLARALSETGDEVALAHIGEAPAHLDLDGVARLPLLPQQPMLWPGLLKAWRPDLVHVHLASQPELLDAIDAMGVPRLRSFHDYTSVCLRRGRRRWPGDRCQRALGLGCVAYGCLLAPPAQAGGWPELQDLGAKLQELKRLRGYEQLVVGSTHMRDMLVRNRCDADRVQLLPYFCRFDPYACGAVALPPKPPRAVDSSSALRILFSGQAVAGKGLLVLLRALSQVQFDWRLSVVSTGPQLDAARQLAAEPGLSGRVDFLGWQPHGEMAALYRSADLLALPSVWDDPGPLVGLEAMAMETPIVAFAVGGIPDYAIDGQTAFMAPSVTPQGLAEALTRAFEQADRLPAMGQAGRALVARVHARLQHVQTLRNIYRKLLRAEAAKSPTALPAVEESRVGA